MQHQLQHLALITILINCYSLEIGHESRDVVSCLSQDVPKNQCVSAKCETPTGCDDHAAITCPPGQTHVLFNGSNLDDNQTCLCHCCVGPNDNNELDEYEDEYAGNSESDGSSRLVIDVSDEYDELQKYTRNIKQIFLSKIKPFLDKISNVISAPQSKSQNIHISFNTIHLNNGPVPEIEPTTETSLIGLISFTPKDDPVPENEPTTKTSLTGLISFTPKDDPVPENEPTTKTSLTDTSEDSLLQRNITIDLVCPNCGIATSRDHTKGPSPRIAGGKFINPPNKYAWLVSMLITFPDNKTYTCGGTILNRRYVLTAAHCIYNNKCLFWDHVAVRVGLHNWYMRNSIPGVTREITVKDIIKHPKYICLRELKKTQFGYLWGNELYKKVPPPANHDIALAQLDDDLDLNDPQQQTGIRPICLPTDPLEMYENYKAIVAGWGWRAPTPLNDEEYPESWYQRQIFPSETTIKINSHLCDVYPSFMIEKNNMICAGKDKGGKDACTGDSGGPLVIKKDGRYILVGVTSMGKPDRTCQGAGIYTRVTAHLYWILESIMDVQDCPFMT